ncbi:NAD(P)H-binding protein [Streptomyces mobaraensis]|uniref:NAD(P)-dependent oxidoreductase n=1 Tax=Streptomyces mobaraensis TaxID=35621 RepID=UPI003319E80E
MHIGVIGASGTIGSRVVTEAAERGHRVTAFTRDASRIRLEERPGVTWQSLDVFDAEGVVAVLPGMDVLISGYQPGNAAADFGDTVERSVADPSVFATAARALLAALASHPRTRLIVIGGAGSLEVEPGLVHADSDAHLHESLDRLGLPRSYAAAVCGHRDALNVLRTSNRLWTYFSPAADIAPGARTGRFRLGGDQPVLDADGRSRISVEDAAVALVDEAELPRFVQRRFTVGY